MSWTMMGVILILIGLIPPNNTPGSILCYVTAGILIASDLVKVGR